MRRLVLLAVLLACKKDPTQAPVPTRGSGGSANAPTADATTGDAAPAGPMVELLHAAPSILEVSSRVANKKIKPDHLVDRDLGTAWNSRTGELAGAWIYVEVPGARIQELRMTAGHTGKGPKGEDYFTMNPRIRTLTVLSDNNVVTTTTLDIERRDLQRIALPAGFDHVRIRVDEVIPGSKPTWRETCVSELEAWGTLRPGTTAKPITPHVEVGEPFAEPRGNEPILDPSAYCTELIKDAVAAKQADGEALAKSLDECHKSHPNYEQDASCMMGIDGPGDPTCEMRADTPIKLGPWTAVGWFEVSKDSIYGAKMVQPVLLTAIGWFAIATPDDCGHFSALGTCDLTIVSTKVHGDVLDLRYRIAHRDETHDYVITCTMATTVTCTGETEVPAKP